MLVNKKAFFLKLVLMVTECYSLATTTIPPSSKAASKSHDEIEPVMKVQHFIPERQRDIVQWRWREEEDEQQTQSDGERLSRHLVAKAIAKREIKARLPFNDSSSDEDEDEDDDDGKKEEQEEQEQEKRVLRMWDLLPQIHGDLFLIEHANEYRFLGPGYQSRRPLTEEEEIEQWVHYQAVLADLTARMGKAPDNWLAVQQEALRRVRVALPERLLSQGSPSEVSGADALDDWLDEALESGLWYVTWSLIADETPRYMELHRQLDPNLVLALLNEMYVVTEQNIFAAVIDITIEVMREIRPAP